MKCEQVGNYGGGSTRCGGKRVRWASGNSCLFEHVIRLPGCFASFSMGFLLISGAICMHSEVSFFPSIMLHFSSMREGTRSILSGMVGAADGGPSRRTGAGIVHPPSAGRKAWGSATPVPPCCHGAGPGGLQSPGARPAQGWRQQASTKSWGRGPAAAGLWWLVGLGRGAHSWVAPLCHGCSVLLHQGLPVGPYPQ